MRHMMGRNVMNNECPDKILSPHPRMTMDGNILDGGTPSERVGICSNSFVTYEVALAKVDNLILMPSLGDFKL